MPDSADRSAGSQLTRVSEGRRRTWRRATNGVDLGPGPPVPWAFPHPDGLPASTPFAVEGAGTPESTSQHGFTRPHEQPVVSAQIAPPPVPGANGDSGGPSNRRASLGIAALVAVFAGAVFWGIGSFGLWRDEAFSVSTSVRSWSGLARLSVTKETNGVLYAVLLKAWTVFGTSEAALRGLSAIAMVVTVALTYVLARRFARLAGLDGPRVGLIAAALTAANGTILEYGQEIRFYALVCVVVLLSMIAFEVELRSPSRRSVLLWSATTVLVPLVHLMAVAVVAAQLATIFALAPTRRRWRRRILALLPVASVTVPLGVLIASRDEGQSLIRFGPAVAGELVQTLSGRSGALGALAVLVIAGFFVLGGWRSMSEVLSGRRDAPVASDGPRVAYAIVLAWAVIPPVILAAASFVQPVLAGRYLIHLIPAMGCAAGLGIEARRSRRRRIGTTASFGFRVGTYAICSVLAASALLGANRWLRHDLVDDWRGTSRLVSDLARHGDGIVFANDSVRLYFEYYRSHPRAVALQVGPQPVFPPGAWGTFATGDHSYRAFTATELRAAEGRVERLWVVVERPLAEHVEALSDLRARHCRIGRWDAGSAAVVELYEFGPLSGGPCR